jgi:hypothetical protein
MTRWDEVIDVADVPVFIRNLLTRGPQFVLRGAQPFDDGGFD